MRLPGSRLILTFVTTVSTLAGLAPGQAELRAAVHDPQGEGGRTEFSAHVATVDEEECREQGERTRGEDRSHGSRDPGATRCPAARERDESTPPPEGDPVARHGDVLLFLTGTCGPRGEGRRAFVQNRNPTKAVKVRIQNSHWIDGLLRSSAVENHSLRPLETRELGCTTSSSRKARRSFDIVWVSNASTHDPRQLADPAHPLAPRRPALDSVELVESGVCGQGGRGRRLSVINRTAHHPITVTVEYRDQVNARVTRTYRKTYTLGPGSERRLGCTRDGRLARQFSLVAAQYR